jgi:hypothetical protein
MHITHRVFMLVAVLAVASGCRDNPMEPPLVFPDGEYALVTINGSALPYLYPETTHTTVSGTFRFTDEDSWVLTSRNCEVIPCVEASTQTVTVLGTYSVSGTTITFQETSPGSLRFEGEFTLDATTLTLDINHPRLGRSLRVYHKQ